MGRTVGIDLGTTNSVLAVMEGGTPVVVANAEGHLRPGMFVNVSVVLPAREEVLAIEPMRELRDRNRRRVAEAISATLKEAFTPGMDRATALRTAVAALPASGSVSTIDPPHRPSSIGCTKRLRCASVPSRSMTRAISGEATALTSWKVAAMAPTANENRKRNPM